MDTILEILKLVSVGLIAGLFSSFIANRDFRHKKWWELRVSAYQNAIEALSDLVHYYDVYYDASSDFQQPSEAKQEELRKLIDNAYPKIRKSADLGAFLFSEKANEALTEFINYRGIDVDSPEDYYGPLRFEAKKCLNSIVSLSKVDLRVRKEWL